MLSKEAWVLLLDSFCTFMVIKFCKRNDKARNYTRIGDRLAEAFAYAMSMWGGDQLVFCCGLSLISGDKLINLLTTVGSSFGGVANMLDCNIVVMPLGKGMNSLIPPNYGLNSTINVPSTRMALALNNLWRLICH